VAPVEAVVPPTEDVEDTTFIPVDESDNSQPFVMPPQEDPGPAPVDPGTDNAPAPPVDTTVSWSDPAPDTSNIGTIDTWDLTDMQWS